MKMNSVLVLALAAPASAIVQRNFLGQGMQPEVVARTLSNVEDEWKAQAAVFAECSNSTSGEEGAAIVNCEDAPASFGKSCATVVNAIIQGSGGDRDVTKEYMADVCGQSAISGWHQQSCNSLAVAVSKAMTADKYENRENFNTNKLCTSFWSQFLTEEQDRLAKEKAEREAAEKKAAEEAAEKEKQRVEQEKKEAERKKAEEAARAKEEAEAKAAEAKAKAAEAAQKAALKKAEAEEVQRAAEKRMEEAEKAVQEHKKALENANATVVENANTTEASAPVEAEPVANATAAAPEPEATPEKENVTQPVVANATAVNATEH